jgi:hypothetical protein
MMTDLGAKLRRMPPDRRRATLANLPSHLANADESDRLYFLLMNFAFIEAKIFELELRSLVEDYVLAVQSPLNIPEEKKGLFWFSCVNFCYELKQANSLSRRCSKLVNP